LNFQKNTTRMKKYFITLKRQKEIILVGLAILFTLAPFYPVIFLNKTLNTASITPGVMGEIPSENFIPTTLENAGNIIDRGGSAWQDEPLSFKTAFYYQKGELPAWNMSQGFGRPLGADMMSGAFSIFKIPFFISPSLATLDFVLLVRICIATLGMLFFLKKQQLSSMAALCGSLAFSLSGYFLYFANMGHIQVEVLIPWLLLAVDYSFTKKNLSSLFLMSFTILLLFMAGHPESMVIALSFSVVFAIWKINSNLTQAIIRNTLKIAWKYISSLSIAMLWGAFFLLPFFEYFLNSYTGNHDIQFKVFEASLPFKSLLLQLFPLLTKHAIQFNILNHWGVLTIFFVLFSVFNKKQRSLVKVLFLVSLILIAKIYGIVSFNWLNNIPILNSFVYYKYLQPELSFIFAVLAAIGFHRFQKFIEKKSIPYKKIIGIIFIIGFLYLLTILYNREALSSVSIKRQIGAFFAPFGVFSIALILVKQLPKKFTKIISPSFLFLILIAGELWLSSPSFKIPRDNNPYFLQPGLKFLQEKQKIDPSRLYSPDGLLYPATSSVFELQDIRDVHAVYPDNYAKYIKRFIFPDLKDRFSDPSLDIHWKDNPFFNLTNTKYILTKQPLSLIHPSDFMLKILSEYPDLQTISSTEFTIDELTKPVLLVHAPTQFSYSFTPTSETSTLKVSPVLSPEIWTPTKSDGVNFIITLQQEGLEEIIFQNTILPTQELPSWKQQSISLNQFIGKNITLYFETKPLTSNAFDWSGWGDLHLDSGADDSSPEPQFLQVYDDEIMIYENTKVFDRAFVVPKVFITSSDDESYLALSNSSFNPKNCSVLITNNEISILPNTLTSSSIEECSAEEIIYSEINFLNYQNTKFELEIILDQDGFLQINDLFYPGWKASVDDVPTPIFQSDLAFRGIPITKGKHTVKMKYEPQSYFIGKIISLSSIGLSILLIVLNKNKR